MNSIKHNIVKKAGGIIRDWKDFIAVHRSRYNDISLPKWHIENWESNKEAALREVMEETGLECEIIGDLGTAEYLNSEWIVQVQYFAMNIKSKVSDSTDEEVDKVIYGDFNKIINQLSYSSDKQIFKKAESFFKVNF